MSERGTPVVGMVCEGPEDHIVVQAILHALMDEYEPWPLHPERFGPAGDFGRLGGGWKGVRSWCEEHAPLRMEIGAGRLTRLGVLVIHFDAVVAGEREVRCRKRCPPASATVDALREVIVRWCGEEVVPEGVVLCIPSKTIEAWILAALYPQKASTVTNLECHGNPQALFPKEQTPHGRGKLRKSQRSYAERAGDITENWPSVCAICTQAERFDQELRAALACPT